MSEPRLSAGYEERLLFRHTGIISVGYPSFRGFPGYQLQARENQIRNSEGGKMTLQYEALHLMNRICRVTRSLASFYSFERRPTWKPEERELLSAENKVGHAADVADVADYPRDRERLPYKAYPVRAIRGLATPKQRQ
jgi:hypothetical protein